MKFQHFHRISTRQTSQVVPAAKDVVSELPDKPEGMTWHEYLLMLLHVGAQIEHCLMVQYLYAAYSLNGKGAHISDKDRPTIQRWQNEILTVAREEMGHLMTVQNLIILLGGANSFEREGFPWDSPFFPYPFQLDPATISTIARFVFAEMPDELFVVLEQEANNQKPSEASLKKLARLLGEMVSNEDYAAYSEPEPEKQAAQRSETACAEEFLNYDLPKISALVGSAIQAEDKFPVSAVYSRILEIIRDPNKIPDSAFRAETYGLQSSWDEWGHGYKPAPAAPSDAKNAPYKSLANAAEKKNPANVLILQAGTRNEAIDAVYQIATQGEFPDLRKNTDTDLGQSHFGRFAQIFHSYAKRLDQDSDWDPTGHVASSPTTAQKGPYLPETSTSITNEQSLRFAELFNIRYRLLLSYLTHTFRLTRTVPANEPNVRGALMHKVFGEMFNLKALSGLLMQMPLTTPDKPERAGPTFEMPYTLDLPNDDRDCWRIYNDILKNALAIETAILKAYENPKHADSLPLNGEEYIRTLKSIDRTSLDWLAQLAGGPKSNSLS